MNLTLRRFQSSAQGTLGELSIDGADKILCFTLELPLMGEGKRAIPPGDGYPVHRYTSPHFKHIVFMLNDVPGFTDVEIHFGNTIRDTRACILVGSAIGELDGLPAVLRSRETLDDLLKALPQTFTLKITNP